MCDFPQTSRQIRSAPALADEGTDAGSDRDSEHQQLERIDDGINHVLGCAGTHVKLRVFLDLSISA